MEAHAVPIRPTIWIWDQGAWVSLDQEEIEERLTTRDRYFLVDVLDTANVRSWVQCLRETK